MCSFINDWYIADTSYTVVLKNISYKLKMMIHLISLYVLLINYQVSEKSGTNWGKTTCTSFCVFRFIYFFLTDEKKMAWTLNERVELVLPGALVVSWFFRH